MLSNMKQHLIKLFIVLLVANLFFMAMLFIQIKKPQTQHLQQEVNLEYSQHLTSKKQEIKPVDLYVYGKENAPNELLVFTRYSCAFCKRFYLESFEGMLKKEIENGNVRILFPFNFNITDKTEMLMAKTTEIAREYGLYEKVQKHFYSLETKPDSLEIIQILPQLGVNEKQYHNRLKDSTLYNHILDQIELGNKRQVTGTPIFFLNGARLDGYESEEKFADFYHHYKK